MNKVITILSITLAIFMIEVSDFAFSKNHSNKDFDLKQLSAQKKKVETQLEKLEELFAIGEIGQD